MRCELPLHFYISQRKNHRGQGRGARGRTHAGTRGHGRAHTQRRARTSTQQTRRPSPHRKTSTNSAPSRDAAEPSTQRTGPSTRKRRQTAQRATPSAHGSATPEAASSEVGAQPTPKRPRSHRPTVSLTRRAPEALDDTRRHADERQTGDAEVGSCARSGDAP